LNKHNFIDIYAGIAKFNNYQNLYVLFIKRINDITPDYT